MCNGNERCLKRIEKEHFCGAVTQTNTKVPMLVVSHCATATISIEDKSNMGVSEHNVYRQNEWQLTKPITRNDDLSYTSSKFRGSLFSDKPRSEKKRKRHSTIPYETMAHGSW
jgi:hypothetical protein